MANTTVNRNCLHLMPLLYMAQTCSTYMRYDAQGVIAHDL